MKSRNRVCRKRLKKIVVVAAGLAFLAFGRVASSQGNGNLQIQQSEETVSLSMNGTLLWQLNHRRAEGKPYFHPLATADGTVFTDLRPKDHPWHRALWFSWKLINGINYWEENRETGLSDGSTKLIRIHHSIASDKTVTVDMSLAYAPADGHEVLSEKRTVTVYPPDTNGAYRMDWDSVSTAKNDNVVLDRTPLPGEEGGKSYGGYAGYSLRMAKTVLGGTFLNSEGASGAEANRKPARWMSYTAPNGGGILILDHPSNIRHPTQWYFVENMPYFSPAVIHDAPYTIKAGASLRLRYRLMVFPGTLDARASEKEWAAWVR